MIWLFGILLFFLLLIVWVLCSALVLQVDTRVMQADMRLGYMASASIWYDSEWRLGVRVFFFRKTMRLAGLKRSTGKKKTVRRKRSPRKKMNARRFIKKMLRVLRTFRITQYELAIDTDDYVLNAQLYPLNFLPYAKGHLLVNFNNENYLALTVRNRPWKILYAFFR